MMIALPINIRNALVKAMAMSLEQKDDFFHEMFKEPFPLLALWRYPALPEECGLWGIGPHTDYGVFTFVLQDDVGGLQVQAKDGTWVDVHPSPGIITKTRAPFSIRSEFMLLVYYHLPRTIIFRWSWKII